MKILSFFLLLSLLYVSSFAEQKSYIVYMGAHSHGPQVTIEDYDRVTDYHHNFLASYLGSVKEAKDALFYSYTRHINGFAANIDEHQAAEIAKHPDVISVFPNKGKKLHTSRTWDFMLLEEGQKPSNSWYAARFGEDTILATLDTGVWPESESFSDKEFGPIPSRWKGTCDEHVTHGHQVHCNRKLIGARHFNKGYKSAGGEVDPYMESARDYEGHGSHTLSTAAGNEVLNANISGLSIGTVKGGSPKARVATYKVCWTALPDGGECFDADILAAFDMAISDGVDVISMSVGGPPSDYYGDAIAIGSFHAVENHIVVVCSAGNDGLPGSVSNVAPWIVTVAASTLDREFSTYVELGNGQVFKGASLSKAFPDNKLYPLISADHANLANVSSNDSLLCKPGTLDPEKVKGKILVCLRGDTDRVDKGIQAKKAGAVGFILCNDEPNGDDIMDDIHVLPAAHLSYKNGSQVFNYINNTKDPMGYINGPKIEYNTKPAPSMADFSSYGPNTVTPEILKPDVTAPGVNVIAAFSAGANPTSVDSDTRRVSYMIMSGTSMACPHVSGTVGLLKTLYPTWSPAAIRSAIMTTARIKDNAGYYIKTQGIDGLDNANPLNYGAGHILPNHIINPGLVYDITTHDYLNFLCALGYNSTMMSAFKPYNCSKEHSKRSTILNLNYPSITVPNLSESVTVTRTVKNVGAGGIYNSHIRQPKGVFVSVKPSTLNIKSGQEMKFEVTFMAQKGLKSDQYMFGELVWSDGEHNVRSPIVVSLPQ